MICGGRGLKKWWFLICFSICARPLIMDSNAVLRSPLPGRIPCPAPHPGSPLNLPEGLPASRLVCPSDLLSRSSEWLSLSSLTPLPTKLSCCPSYRQFLKYRQRFAWIVTWQPALQSEATVYSGLLKDRFRWKCKINIIILFPIPGDSYSPRHCNRKGCFYLSGRLRASFPSLKSRETRYYSNRGTRFEMSCLFEHWT